MHTVIETPAFLASAAEEGIDEDERLAIVTSLALRPDAGTIIPGTGGARKVRFAGRGMGKSGGYRVITFFADNDIPVFLIDVYSKDSQANLSKGDRNELKKLLTALPQAWRQQMRSRIATMRQR